MCISSRNKKSLTFPLLLTTEGILLLWALNICQPLQILSCFCLCEVAGGSSSDSSSLSFVGWDLFDWLGLFVQGYVIQTFPVARQTFLFGELVTPQRPKISKTPLQPKKSPYCTVWGRFSKIYLLFYHRDVVCLLLCFGNFLSSVENSNS